MEPLHRSLFRLSSRLTLPAGLMALALTSAAQAQLTDAQKATMKSSCRSDYMSNCMSVKPGGIEALQCLQKNMTKLSPGCQTAVKSTMPPPPKAAAAPPPPAAAAPAPAVAAPKPAVVSAPPPPARVARPARAAAPPPAPPSRQAVAAPPSEPPAPTAAQLNAIKMTCRGDFRRNCRGVPPGGAEAIACLQRHAGRLAPDCKIALADIADSLPATPVATVAPPPPVARRPNAPVAMTAVIGRACLRDLIRRCRNTGAGDGQKIACLMAHGPQLAPLCKAALKITEPVR